MGSNDQISLWYRFLSAVLIPIILWVLQKQGRPGYHVTIQMAIPDPDVVSAVDGVDEVDRVDIDGRIHPFTDSPIHPFTIPIVTKSIDI